MSWWIWTIWAANVLFFWGLLSYVVARYTAPVVRVRPPPRTAGFEETFGTRMPNSAQSSRRYVLTPSGFGPSGEVRAYDVFYDLSGDGTLAGSLIFRSGSEERHAFWELVLPHDPQMPRGGFVFKRHTDALSWLGNPKIVRQ